MDNMIEVTLTLLPKDLATIQELSQGKLRAWPPWAIVVIMLSSFGVGFIACLLLILALGA